MMPNDRIASLRRLRVACVFAFATLLMIASLSAQAPQKITEIVVNRLAIFDNALQKEVTRLEPNGDAVVGGKLTVKGVDLLADLQSRPRIGFHEVHLFVGRTGEGKTFEPTGQELVFDDQSPPTLEIRLKTHNNGVPTFGKKILGTWYEFRNLPHGAPHVNFIGPTAIGEKQNELLFQTSKPNVSYGVIIFVLTEE